MDGLFNNREVAAAIWLATLFILGLCWKVTRKGAADVLRALFKLNLLIPLLLSFLPAALVVLVLAYLGWWDSSVLKETIYWFIGTGLAMFGGFTHVQRMSALLKKTAKEALALAIIIEFFVGFYVFPLWVELLLLPFTTLVILTATVAKYQKTKGIEVTRKFLDGLMVGIGLVVLLSATIEFVHDPRVLFTYKNVELFLLPITLSFAYIPSVYLIALYSKYELVFNRINYPMSKDIKNKWILKAACIKQCGLSVRLAGEMIPYLAMRLTPETTKSQALELILKFSSEKSG